MNGVMVRIVFNLENYKFSPSKIDRAANKYK